MTVNDRVPKRKAIPMGVKLQACLRMMGYDSEDEIEWDHIPALARRAVNEDGTDWVPAQLDPEYIRPMRKADHARKTTGRKGTSKLSSDGNGDTTQAAKIKRIAAARQAMFETEVRLMMDDNAALRTITKPKPKYSWPSGRKIESRGFAKPKKR
jgi:hypothetical protein